MSFLTKLTDEERELIDNYVRKLRSPPSPIVELDETWMMYGYHHGRLAPLFLLHAYYGEIITHYDFTPSEIEALDQIAAQINRNWFWLRDVDEISDWERIVYEGWNYVILDNGTRIDLGEESNKSEREEFIIQRQEWSRKRM